MKFVTTLLLSFFLSAQTCPDFNGQKYTFTFDGCQQVVPPIVIKMLVTDGTKIYWMPVPITAPGTSSTVITTVPPVTTQSFKMIDKLPGWECITTTGTCCTK